MPELVFEEVTGCPVEKGYHFFFLFIKSVFEEAYYSSKQELANN